MNNQGKGANCIKQVFLRLKQVCVDACAKFLAGTPKAVRALLVLLTLTLGLTGGIYVYAKYYSVSSRKGIAIATGVYFTANYAVSTTEDGEFVESLVNSSYMGTDTGFTFEIRNYENNLLFNTSDVDIPYTVEFWLGEDTDEASYLVAIGESEDAASHTLSADSKVAFTDQMVKGGAAKANKYRITVDVNEDIKHDPVPVFVEVRTVEGSLINRILKGKMLLNSSDMTESYIESQQFVVPDETEDMSADEKFAVIQNLAALTYEIRTVGDVTSTGEATEKLTLKWDPTVLQIDLFDEAYMKWQESTGASAPAVESDGWYSIVIDAMPYASESIGFFRGTDFDTKATDLDTLHLFIEAEKYASS